MRISKRQAEENRTRVLQESARLFRQRGFDGVSVADVMTAAGMTHGGFYNHFASKADLQASACTHLFGEALAIVERVADAAAAPDGTEALTTYVEHYLSPRARDATGPRCPMVAFAGDVSRQGEGVREAYAEGLETYLTTLARAVAATRHQEFAGTPETGPRERDDAAAPPAPSAGDRSAAIALFAAMVGGLTLARSVAATDPALSDEILAAVRGALTEKSVPEV